VSGATFSQSSGRYEVPMNQVVTFTATEANAASWVWDFGDGTSATGRTVQHSFTQLGGPNASLTVVGDGTNTIGTSSSVIAFTIIDPAVLYLNDRRFEVRTSWVSNGQGTSGVGTAVQLTPDTGYFWFFSPSNLEVVVKVLDACTVDGYFGLGGGLTNLGVQMTVLDTFTGATSLFQHGGPGLPADPGHALRGLPGSHRRQRDHARRGAPTSRSPRPHRRRRSRATRFPSRRLRRALPTTRP
jgi:hypothetical protein